MEPPEPTEGEMDAAFARVEQEREQQLVKRFWDEMRDDRYPGYDQMKELFRVHDSEMHDNYTSAIHGMTRWFMEDRCPYAVLRDVGTRMATECTRNGDRDAGLASLRVLFYSLIQNMGCAGANAGLPQEVVVMAVHDVKGTCNKAFEGLCGWQM